MRASFVCWIVFVLACSTTRPVPRAPLERAPSVLFVGNSLTYFHDMPAAFARYVEQAYGQRVHVKMIATPGESLAGHRKAGRVADEIRGGAWTHVVLQDRGVGTWKLDGVLHAGSPDAYIDDVAYFAGLARARGATPVIYQNWGPPAMQPFLEYAAQLAARRGRATLAPIGRAWHRAADPALLDGDGMHPSPRGSALIAITIAHALFGAPARATASFGLSVAEVATLQAAAREALASTTDVPKPVYTPEPAVVAGAPMRGLAGTWRARRGGTRLSAGTELVIAEGTRIVVREYTPSERVEIPIQDARIEGDVLRFTLPSANVPIAFELALDGGALRGFTCRGAGTSRRDHRSVRFERDGERAHFAKLDVVYRQRDREERTLGLAKALARHYPRLAALLGEAGMTELLEGAPLDAWVQIIAAWFHYERDEPRAVAYLRAAVELHPDSHDAHFQLGDALAQRGHPDEARVALLRAKALAAGADREVREQIDRALVALPAR